MPMSFKSKFTFFRACLVKRESLPRVLTAIVVRGDCFPNIFDIFLTGEIVFLVRNSAILSFKMLVGFIIFCSLIVKLRSIEPLFK
jgi:hypothetical protein